MSKFSRTTAIDVVDYFECSDSSKLMENIPGAYSITSPYALTTTEDRLVWDEWGEPHKEDSKLYLELNT